MSINQKCLKSLKEFETLVTNASGLSIDTLLTDNGESARSMMCFAGLPNSYWGEAVATAEIEEASKKRFHLMKSGMGGKTEGIWFNVMFQIKGTS